MLKKWNMKLNKRQRKCRVKIPEGKLPSDLGVVDQTCILLRQGRSNLRTRVHIKNSSAVENHRVSRISHCPGNPHWCYEVCAQRKILPQGSRLHCRFFPGGDWRAYGETLMLWEWCCDKLTYSWYDIKTYGGQLTSPKLFLESSDDLWYPFDKAGFTPKTYWQ